MIDIIRCGHTLPEENASRLQDFAQYGYGIRPLRDVDDVSRLQQWIGRGIGGEHGGIGHHRHTAERPLILQPVT